MIKTVARTRVLVAYEDEYRAYREVIAAAIGLLRPLAEVRTVGANEFGAELERFGPWVVVCGVSGRPDPGHAAAWVELHSEVGRPARVRVGGRRWEAAGPTLEWLLRVLDEAEELVGKAGARTGEWGPP